ncbi:serine/threonine protein kinase [Actinophytocola algeriensis]|uniref:non-specific serine/threonine protein kinase n=1 Tax=Actinophytocola algeriensis TaxID=1768010 RepID=A0A7W7VDJ2_9PSEU|nr:serine/threonine protein kinase [Actinophytocola algeriensis]MBE1472093.1 serine/threonine protein kinase [Actinophytocola algeriensis]
MYEALDVMLGCPVAVKMFQPEGNAVARYRFTAEARLLAGLAHPALVTVYDVCLDSDKPFLVMQLVNGPLCATCSTAAHWNPPPSPASGARLADVLAYVHARDIVHRDIKLQPEVQLVERAYCST